MKDGSKYKAGRRMHADHRGCTSHMLFRVDLQTGALISTGIHGLLHPAVNDGSRMDTAKRQKEDESHCLQGFFCRLM